MFRDLGLVIKLGSSGLLHVPSLYFLVERRSYSPKRGHYMRTNSNVYVPIKFLLVSHFLMSHWPQQVT